jgi:hypothetical protein
MTPLEQLVAEQESAPNWKIAARASRGWKLVFRGGTEILDTCEHVLSPVRCWTIATQEWMNAQPQGCTSLDVYLDETLVHTFN